MHATLPCGGGSRGRHPSQGGWGAHTWPWQRTPVTRMRQTQNISLSTNAIFFFFFFFLLFHLQHTCSTFICPDIHTYQSSGGTVWAKRLAIVTPVAPHPTPNTHTHTHIHTHTPPGYGWETPASQPQHPCPCGGGSRGRRPSQGGWGAHTCPS